MAGIVTLYDVRGWRGKQGSRGGWGWICVGERKSELCGVWGTQGTGNGSGRCFFGSDSFGCALGEPDIIIGFSCCPDACSGSGCWEVSCVCGLRVRSSRSVIWGSGSRPVGESREKNQVCSGRWWECWQRRCIGNKFQGKKKLIYYRRGPFGVGAVGYFVVRATAIVRDCFSGIWFLWGGAAATGFAVCWDRRSCVWEQKRKPDEGGTEKVERQQVVRFV